MGFRCVGTEWNSFPSVKPQQGYVDLKTSHQSLFIEETISTRTRQQTGTDKNTAVLLSSRGRRLFTQRSHLRVSLQQPGRREGTKEKKKKKPPSTGGR